MVCYLVQSCFNFWVSGLNSCDHSYFKNPWAVFSYGTVSDAAQSGSTFWVYGRNPQVWPFKQTLLSSTFLWHRLLRRTRWFKVLSLWVKSWSVTIQTKATKQYFPVALFIKLYKVVLGFESLDEILKCDYSNESYWAVLSCGTVYYAVPNVSNVSSLWTNPKLWPFNHLSDFFKSALDLFRGNWQIHGLDTSFHLFVKRRSSSRLHLLSFAFILLFVS